jgi:hypothetical protein
MKRPHKGTILRIWKAILIFIFLYEGTIFWKIAGQKFGLNHAYCIGPPLHIHVCIIVYVYFVFRTVYRSGGLGWGVWSDQVTS